MTTRCYALRDDQWERIKDWLPGREGVVGVTANNNRLLVEAVLYRYRSGIPWRDLPQRLGLLARFTPAFDAGLKQEYGNKCFRR